MTGYNAPRLWQLQTLTVDQRDDEYARSVNPDIGPLVRAEFRWGDSYADVTVAVDDELQAMIDALEAAVRERARGGLG